MRPQSPDDHPATGPHHLRNAFGSALIFTAHAVAQTSAPRLRTLYNFTGGSDGRDPERAARVRRRSRESVARMVDFPGDLTTGILDEDEEAEERFAALPDEEYCPALDPDALTCDLYEARPIT